MEDKHLAAAVAILKSIHYITLATVCEDGSPWNSPVSATIDADLNFSWGSNADNIHSQNIGRDGRVFVVIFDSKAAEGTGEGLYLKGTAEELGQENDSINKYRFIANQAWVNDEAKNENGSYKHDIRVELNLDSLKESFSK
ncbi:MAG: hypothetical protein JWN18_229 [Parcubacteria group bacterium]|nr:hypothetical protein [Parcubacteria group bacterium]